MFGYLLEELFLGYVEPVKMLWRKSVRKVAKDPCCQNCLVCVQCKLRKQISQSFPSDVFQNSYKILPRYNCAYGSSSEHDYQTLSKTAEVFSSFILLIQYIGWKEPTKLSDDEKSAGNYSYEVKIPAQSLAQSKLMLLSTALLFSRTELQASTICVQDQPNHHPTIELINILCRYGIVWLHGEAFTEEGDSTVATGKGYQTIKDVRGVCWSGLPLQATCQRRLSTVMRKRLSS